ncbi:putative aminotransferase TAT2, partial [Mucuna pruriens]
MESGVVAVNNNNYESKATSTITIKGILSLLMESIDGSKSKRVICLGMGDPTLATCFHTSKVVEEAVADTLHSHKFHGYAPTAGLLQARIAIAEYLSRDLPYQLSSDDVFITCGCTQAIDVSVAMLARPGANILLPRPGFPIYEL